jgi:hypothetical protein
MPFTPVLPTGWQGRTGLGCGRRMPSLVIAAEARLALRLDRSRTFRAGVLVTLMASAAAARSAALAAR